MTNQQIATKLKNSGFGTKLYSNCTKVFLNRPISKSEVKYVLNDIPSEVIVKRYNYVLVFGIDS